MTPPAETPAQLAALIAGRLAEAGIPYAVGGAIAYTFWGEPRATRDLDINLFLKAEEAGSALRLLAGIGVMIDVEAAIRSGIERGDAKGYFGDIRVDIFFLSIALHESASRRTIEVPLGGSVVRILSAEDLTLFKLLFFRGKDIVDTERILALQGSQLDRGYVRRWLLDCVGEDDERTRKWDALCAALPPEPMKS